jgi:hypothetical protein
MDELLREAVAADAEQKKQERAAEKKWKEEAEKKRRAVEAARKVSAESAKSSKGKSKEVVVESDDDSEGPEFPKTKKRKLAGGKSKTDESVVEAVVSCIR